MDRIHLRDALARAWADHLAGVTGCEVFATRRVGRPEPPYTVVTVKRLNHATGTGGGAFSAEVRFVMVSDAADSKPDEHSARVRDMEAAILTTPSPAQDANLGVMLLGYELDDVGQASGQDDDGRKLYADVFMVTAGVAEG